MNKLLFNLTIVSYSNAIYIYLKLNLGKFSAQAKPTLTSCKEKNKTYRH